MEEPGYILNFDESIIRTEKKGFWAVIQNVCIGAFIVMIVGSLLLRTNLLGKLSAYEIFTFVSLFIASVFNMKHVCVPSPIELRFYPDHMVVYRDKTVYSEREVQRETYDMRYADVTRFILRTSSNRLSVSSRLHFICYKYNKDGTLPDKPYRDMVVNSGYTINLHFIGDLDIVKEIETHSPIRVVYEDS